MDLSGRFLFTVLRESQQISLAAGLGGMLHALITVVARWADTSYLVRTLINPGG